MIEVNLLEVETGGDPRGRAQVAEKWRVPWQTGLLALSILGSLTYTLLSLHTLSRRSSELGAALSRAVADSALAGPLDEGIDVHALRDSLARRAETLEAVYLGRDAWPHLLGEIVAAMPAGLWLTSIVSLAPASVPSQTRIEGVAHDYARITEFQDRLRQVPELASVAEESVDTDRSVSWLPSHRFSLVLHFRRPSPGGPPEADRPQAR